MKFFVQKRSKRISARKKASYVLTLCFLLVFSIVYFAIGFFEYRAFTFSSFWLEGASVAAKGFGVQASVNSQNLAILQAAANIDPNPNKIGNIAPIAQNTLIPDIALNNGTDSDQTSTQIDTYIVRDGDTVSGIAKMFKVSVNTILWANDLNSRSVLHAGQSLVILPVSGVMYTVKKGDTISAIAKKFSADEGDIIAYNDLSVATLRAGQDIIIPNAEISTPTKTTSQNTVGSNEPLLDKVTGLPSFPGFYSRPISGGRISQKLHGHNGVDFAAPVGTPIAASADGVVIISRINGGWNGGYGNFVVISHKNGTQTLYAHMQSKTVVKAGEQVKQGSIIGYIGMTGLTTGPHVHFEIRGAKNPF